MPLCMAVPQLDAVDIKPHLGRQDTARAHFRTELSSTSPRKYCKSTLDQAPEHLHDILKAIFRNTHVLYVVVHRTHIEVHHDGHLRTSELRRELLPLASTP